MTRIALPLVLVGLLTASALSAQWLNHPTPGIPRTAEGKPDLSAPTPRMDDGRVDFSGIWERVEPVRPPTPFAVPSDYTGYLVKGSVIDMLPTAAQIHRKIVSDNGRGHPSEVCLPKTFPNQILLSPPIQIVQTRGITFILFEEFNHFRQILADGRSHQPT